MDSIFIFAVRSGRISFEIHVFIREPVSTVGFCEKYHKILLKIET